MMQFLTDHIWSVMVLAAALAIMLGLDDLWTY